MSRSVEAVNISTRMTEFGRRTRRGPTVTAGSTPDLNFFLLVHDIADIFLHYIQSGEVRERVLA